MVNRLYEILKNTRAKEKVKMSRVEMTIRKAFISVVVDGIILLQVVEQGYGQRYSDMHVYYHLEHKWLVQKWFNKMFLVWITLENKQSIVMLVV